ncbi:hypothetical protein, partial [Acinetobacter baumannii]
FNHILNSKISYQKNIILEHFSINFGYSDGTFREINGSEALSKFLETRSIDTTSINLNWKIIIKFDHSPTIETQEIDLLFISSIEKKINDEDFSYIELSINHTNQSWALDILSAFKDKINEIAIKPSILKEKYNKITDNLFFATIVPMFFIVLGLGLTIPVAQNETQRLRQDLVQYNLKQNYKDDLSKVVGLLNITTLERSELKELGTKNKEIEKIIEKNQKNVALHLTLIVLLFIIPFVVRKYIKYSINYFNHKSFILVNNYSQRKLQKYKDDKSKITYIGFTVFVTSITFSILASVIFKVLDALVF